MKKILIIEDDSFLSEMYETKLTQSGFEVGTAFDGKTGLNKAKDGSYDLILLDIVLPKMDGFEVLSEIKKPDSAIKETPVVLLTNLGQKSEVEKGIRLGADEYIIKAHFTPTAVVDKIKRLFKE
ncbi:MAG: response regulator [Patescibacteria group bacterium]|nr:response regulator [Patescibacteria group bacterium]